MREEILEYAVYSTAEAEKILKISNSTMKRLLKVGLIRANKIGGQYRILGKELLRLVSPEFEERVVRTYKKAKSDVNNRLKIW